ncbi:TPA: hypothetical protein ACKQPR_004094 [Serratia odorifera]|nr:hypothetical protein [Serratia odorifera]
MPGKYTFIKTRLFNVSKQYLLFATFTVDKKIILSPSANAGPIVLLKQQGKVLLQKISLACKQKIHQRESVPNGIELTGWSLCHPDYWLVPGEHAAVRVSRLTRSSPPSLAMITRARSPHPGKSHDKKQNKTTANLRAWQCHHQRVDKSQREITITLTSKLFSINARVITNASHNTAGRRRGFIHSFHYLIHRNNQKSEPAAINNRHRINITLKNDRLTYWRTVAEHHDAKHHAIIHGIKNIVGYLPMGVSPYYIKGNR